MTRKIIAVAGLVGLMTTCGRESPLPSPTPPDPTIVTLAIGGPGLVQPGASTQFSAIATFSDKTSRDVTAAAVWRTSNPAVFGVTAGLLTAMTAGEGSLTVSYQGRSAGLNIVSLPAGTGILVGTVREVSFPVSGATVEVVGGPLAGSSTTTDAFGFYRLNGVVGDLQIRTSREGYVPQTKGVTVTPFATPRRDQRLDFDLTSAGRILSLAGTYRVSLRASATCSTRLTPDAAVRQYTATITQDGSRLTIVLGGGEFAVDSTGVPSNHFEGRAKTDSVELAVGSLSFYYYYENSWGIVERLANPQSGAWGFAQNIYLSVAGTAAGPATPSTISAALNGTLALDDAPGGFFGQRRRLNSCNARDHELTFTRQ
jgi:hypothetical protein